MTDPGAWCRYGLMSCLIKDSSGLQLLVDNEVDIEGNLVHTYWEVRNMRWDDRQEHRGRIAQGIEENLETAKASAEHWAERYRHDPASVNLGMQY